MNFLKVSTTVWLYKLPIDNRARPYLERAWTHYVYRVGVADPTMFHRWLMSVRERNITTPFGVFRFTISHYDFLLNKLLSFLNLTLTKSNVKPPNGKPSAIKAPKQHHGTPKRVAFADERPRLSKQTLTALSKELKPQDCPEKLKSCAKLKRKRKKNSKVTETETKDLQSKPAPEPAPIPEPSRSAKRSKVQVPVSPPKTTRMDDNTHHSVSTDDRSDTESVRTLSTISDDIRLSPRRRIKRAVVRFVVRNRETCRCELSEKLKAGDTSVIPDAFIDAIVEKAVPNFDTMRRLPLFSLIGEIMDEHHWCRCRNCFAVVIGGLSAYAMTWSIEDVNIP